MPKKGPTPNAAGKRKKTTNKAQARKAYQRRKEAKAHVARPLNGATKYAASLLNPFETELCGVPTFPILPSTKYRCFVRGTFGAAAGTTAWIWGGPACASDIAHGYYSTATCVTTTFASSGTGVATLNSSNSLLSDSEIGADLSQVKVVSCGLRVRYIGSELNRSGRIVAIEEPSHGSLLSLDLQDIRGYDRAVSVPVTRDWVTVNWQPVRREDLEYQEGSNVKPYASTRRCLGIMVDGYTGDAANFMEFEFFTNNEMIGLAARSKTLGEDSPVTAEHVITSVSKLGTAAMDSIVRLSKEALYNALSDPQRIASLFGPRALEWIH